MPVEREGAYARKSAALVVDRGLSPERAAVRPAFTAGNIHLLDVDYVYTYAAAYVHVAKHSPELP